MADVYIPDDSDSESEEGALSVSSTHSAVLIGSDDDEIIDVEAVSQPNNRPQVGEHPTKQINFAVKTFLSVICVLITVTLYLGDQFKFKLPSVDT